MSEAAHKGNGANGNGESDRDARGRFIPGHKGGPGNPGIKNLRMYRQIINDSTDTRKIKQAWEQLQDQAAEGQPWAIRELFDRLFGKAKQVIILDDDGAIQQDAFQNWFNMMMGKPRVIRAIEAEMLEDHERGNGKSA